MVEQWEIKDSYKLSTYYILSILIFTTFPDKDPQLAHAH